MKKAELGPPCMFPLPRLPRGLGSGLCGRPGAPDKDSLREGEGQATVLVQGRGAGAGGSIFSPPQGLPPHPRQGAQSSMASGSPEAVWGPQGSGSTVSKALLHRGELKKHQMDRARTSLMALAKTPCSQFRGQGFNP